MSIKIREALNATGMSLTLTVAGLSRLGLRVAGSWVGTVTFFFSNDGINFAPNPLSVQPFASGTAVTSSTANGTWFADVNGVVAVRVVFTRTSGTALVTIAASNDASYQDALLDSSSLFISQSVTAGATNIVTVAASTNRGWRLRSAVVSFDTAPSAAVLCTVKDGTTVIWAEYMPAAAGSAKLNLPADPNQPGVTGGGVYNTIGAALVVTLAGPGGSVVSTVNAEIEPF